MNDQNRDRIGRIRGEIFGILPNEISKDEAEAELFQCLDFMFDIGKVAKIAEELGLKLSGFISDNIQELYFNIEKEGRDVACISKGWGDPGFRIHEVFPCRQEHMAAFRSNVDKILNLCATNGIGLGVRNDTGQLDFDLNINIYHEGFNAIVLKNTLEILEMTKNKIQSYLRN